MFEQMNSFQQAFAPVGTGGTTSPTPVNRRSKSFKDCIVFWTVNLIVVLPAILVVYLTIVAEGLRYLLGAFATPLSRTPIPGAGMLRDLDGWDRADIASVTALILSITVSYIWYRIFNELSGHGNLMGGQRSSIVGLLLLAISLVLVVGDSLIFYCGISSQANTGWTETPAYVSVGATILYAVGLAFLGAYHSDYHTSGEV